MLIVGFVLLLAAASPPQQSQQDQPAQPQQAAQPQQKVYRVGEEGVSQPRLVKRVEPQYSDAARDANIFGDVLLVLEVTPEGKTENITVRRGLEPSLDRSAVKAVEQWKFEPGRKKDGSAVRVRVAVEISFKHL